HGFHFMEGDNSLQAWVYRLAERVAGLRTDALVVINAMDKRQAMRHRIVPKDRLVLMPGSGIDVNRYENPEQTSDNLLNELDIPASVKIVICIGELNANKQPLKVLEAWA